MLSIWSRRLTGRMREGRAGSAADCSMCVDQENYGGNAGVRNADRRSQVTGSLIQAVGGVIVMVLQVVQAICLVPLFVRFIGDDRYAQWMATGGVLALGGMFEMGTGSLMIALLSRRAAHGQLTEAKRDFLVGIAFAAASIVMAFAVLAIFGIGLIRRLALPLGNYSDLSQAYLVAAVGTCLGMFVNPIRALPLAMMKPVVPIVVSILAMLLSIGLTIALLGAGWGIFSFGCGTVVRSLFVVVGLGGYTWWQLRHTPLRWAGWQSTAATLLRLSPITLAITALQSVVGQLEPLLLGLTSNLSVTFAYGVALRPFAAAIGLSAIVHGSVLPAMSRLGAVASKDSFALLHRRIVLIETWVTAMIVVAFTAVAPAFVTLWVGERPAALDQVPFAIMAIAAVATAASSASTYLFYASGNHAEAQFVVLAESAARILLLPMGYYLAGTLGMASAGIFATVPATIYTMFRLSDRRMSVALWSMRVLAVAALMAWAAGMGSGYVVNSWWSVVGVAALAVALVCMSFALCDAETVSWLMSQLVRRRRPTGQETPAE